MEHYYNSDPEIQKSEEKIEYYKTVIETLSEIINNLNWRHQTIGNIIKWKLNSSQKLNHSDLQIECDNGMHKN